MKTIHDVRQARRGRVVAAVMLQDALRGEDGLLPAERSVNQARWLLGLVFSIYVGMTLAGLLLG
jgi:hypothetical protein